MLMNLNETDNKCNIINKLISNKLQKKEKEGWKNVI